MEKFNGQVSYFFFEEDVVDDFERCFVGTDIVEREDGVDDLSPLVVIGGQGGEFEPRLQGMYESWVGWISLMEDNGRVACLLRLFVQY